MDPRHSDPQVPLPGLQAPRPGLQPPRPGLQAPRSGLQAPRPGLQPPRPGLQLLSPAHNEESDDPTDLSSGGTSAGAESGLTECWGSDCSPGGPSEGSVRRGLEAVNPPAPSASPLSLPGVMDAEGRVDESRLRRHILKNGESFFFFLKYLYNYISFLH